jgi:hypothetical protein
MTLDWLALIVAGLAGTIALTAVMLLGTALGAGRLNFPMLLGTMFAPPGPQALAIGFAWHFLNGVVFALVYAATLAGLSLAADWTSGAMLGLAHLVVVGVLLAAAGAVHPRIRRGHMPAPGPFASRYGAAGVAVLLVAHVAFGALVGGLLELF